MTTETMTAPTESSGRRPISHESPITLALLGALLAAALWIQSGVSGASSKAEIVLEQQRSMANRLDRLEGLVMDLMKTQLEKPK